MIVDVVINGKEVAVAVSEDNGPHQPMTMCMSFYKLTKAEKIKAKKQAIGIYKLTK